MRLSDRKPYRFPHDKFWDIYRNAFQFELSITLFTNVIPQELEIMARPSNLWRFIYAFQSVNAILLTWSEKVEKEGPIISPSISDFVYDVYCLKKLVLIHDDTRCKWTLSTSDLDPSKQPLLPCLLSHNHLSLISQCEPSSTFIPNCLKG